MLLSSKKILLYRKMLLMAGDGCVFMLALAVATAFRFGIEGSAKYIIQRQWSFIALFLLYFVHFYVADMYNIRKNFKDLREAFLIMGLGAVWIGGCQIVSYLIFFSRPEMYIGHGILLIFGTLFVCLLLAWRYFFTWCMEYYRFFRRGLILGIGRGTEEILKEIESFENIGIEVVGYVDEDISKYGSVIAGIPVIGSSSSLEKWIHTWGIDLLIVDTTERKYTDQLKRVVEASHDGIEVVDASTIYEEITGKVSLERIDDWWLLTAAINRPILSIRRAKRIMDIFNSLLLIALAAPLMALIAVLIKLDDGGPVFYQQERLGKGRRPFKILKFRTMIPGAEGTYIQWAREGDSRITRIGRLLRKYRLDEIPQLFNVLIGDMSLVGPRPERELFIREFMRKRPVKRPGLRITDPEGTEISVGEEENIPFYSQRLSVPPGITGWAQVNFPYAGSWGETDEKLRYDLYYIKNISLALDMAILMKTIRIMLTSNGAR